ncbi:MAG: SPOR domain-containing protein [Oligoflexia bacterium]|nr:SPOR domain-containing protein [Oligoflexia bacterium]
MNKRNLRYWEFKVGLVQAVVLLGVICGSVACAFFLGLYTGQKTGFENAMASSVASVARLPVVVDQENALTDEDTLSQVYARLSDYGADKKNPGDKSNAAADTSAKGAEIPELNKVKDLEDAPLDIAPPADDADTEEHPALGAKNDAALKAKADVNEAVNKALGEGSTGSKANSRTLGALLNDSADDKKVDAPAIAATDKRSNDKLTAEKKAVSDAAPLAKANTKADNLKNSPAYPQNSEAPIIRDLADVAKPEKASAAKIVKENAVKDTANKAVAAKNAQPPVKAQSATVLPRGWFAQVAAPKKRGDADGLAAKLRASGFTVTIESAEVRGDQYFRVLVGPEDSRDQAQRLSAQLARERYLQGQPFIRMVK